MSLESVLKILDERGLSIVVRHDGQPFVHGKPSEVTDAIREALAAYRDEIIARFPRARRFYQIVKLKTDDPFGEIEKVVEEHEITGKQPSHVERLNVIADADLLSRYAVCWRNEAVVHA